MSGLVDTLIGDLYFINFKAISISRDMVFSIYPIVEMLNIISGVFMTSNINALFKFLQKDWSSMVLASGPRIVELDIIMGIFMFSYFD
jgi:hypothetical protein